MDYKNLNIYNILLIIVQLIVTEEIVLQQLLNDNINIKILYLYSF